MKKIVYVVEDRPRDGFDGDWFQSGFTFNKEEAIEAARSVRRHLTRCELKKSVHYVLGYEVDVEDGVDAEAAYDEFVVNDDSLSGPDPVDCIDITLPEEHND